MKKILMALFLLMLVLPSTTYPGNFQKQGQLQGQKTIVQGDSGNDYFFGAPALPATNGIDSLNAHSPWGGIGISETAEHEYATIRLNMIGALYSRGVIDEKTARSKALNAWEQLEEATKPSRFLGFLWRTRGKNLSNGLGLLSWRSFRSE